MVAFFLATPHVQKLPLTFTYEVMYKVQSECKRNGNKVWLGEVIHCTS